MKNECGVTPLPVSVVERVALHADLTILARLGVALSRAVALAAQTTLKLTLRAAHRLGDRVPVR